MNGPETPSFQPGSDLLAARGYPAPARIPGSAHHFPDGGLWRVEIPTVEGPDALSAAIDEAERLDVPIHRISQGSGVTLLSDAEIREMVLITRERQIELCLFARPGASWDIGAASRSSAGSTESRSRGLVQLGAVLDEIRRGVDLGVTSFLVADEGALWEAHQLREQGLIPAGTQFKTSVMAAPTNPAAFRVNAMLGADTINVPSDLTIAQLAEMRAVSAATMDFYVEAPDNIGGFVRHHEIHDIIRVAAPVYVKFGLRNAPDIYPSGIHLADLAVSSTRERVRRARLGLDVLARSPLPMSELGQRDQPTPDRFPAPAVAAAVNGSGTR